MQLGIPPENIFANQLLFGTSGEYVGFDPSEPTSRSGGKAVAVQNIRQVLILTLHSAMLLLIKHIAYVPLCVQKCGYRTLFMVGDGATDLEVLLLCP